MDQKKRRAAHIKRNGHVPKFDERYGGRCRTCNLARKSERYATNPEYRKRHAATALKSKRKRMNERAQ
jgi:hypothetical protein